MSVLLFKKIVALFALVDPITFVPIFLAATAALPRQEAGAIARNAGLTVAVALVTAGLIGQAVLSTIGLSLGGMRVGGGIIVMITAIAMVVGREKALKQTAEEAAAPLDLSGRGVVPLGIPMLAGPAALSFMMTHGPLTTTADYVETLLPPLVIGLAVWLTFFVALRSRRWMSPVAVNVFERIAGFLLAGIAIDMIASGVKLLFPSLAG